MREDELTPPKPWKADLRFNFAPATANIAARWLRLARRANRKMPLQPSHWRLWHHKRRKDSRSATVVELDADDVRE